jgi:hypothetical protein
MVMVVVVVLLLLLPAVPLVAGVPKRMTSGRIQ